MLKLFTTGELRILMSDYGGDDLLADLPVEAPANELFFAAVDALGNRGLIDEHLFQHLLEQRPVRADEVRAVMRLFVPANPHDAGLLERLHVGLGQPDPLGALELIRDQSSYFFPEEHDGTYTIIHTPHLYTEHRILGLATAKHGFMMTDQYTWTYLGVPAVDAPLLGESEEPSGPALSPYPAVRAAIEDFLHALNAGPEELRHDGERHLFIGRRRQLETSAARTAWTSLKEEMLVTCAVHIHTRDSLLRHLAVSAFGEGWARVVPPDSPLMRPL